MENPTPAPGGLSTDNGEYYKVRHPFWLVIVALGGGAAAIAKLLKNRRNKLGVQISDPVLANIVADELASRSGTVANTLDSSDSPEGEELIKALAEKVLQKILNDPAYKKKLLKELGSLRRQLPGSFLTTIILEAIIRALNAVGVPIP